MIDLDSMAVEMPEVEGHPNRAKFCGILTVVDVPSQKAPSGSGGKRVVLTRKAAEAALPSLIGMALDYAPTFDRHDARRKVGVITQADVVERNLEVGGYLYAKDFPDIVEEIAKCGKRRPSSSHRQQMNGTSTGDYLRTSLAHAVAELRSLSAGVRRLEAACHAGGVTRKQRFWARHVVRSHECEPSRRAGTDLDFDRCHLHGSGHFASGQGRLSGHLDRVGLVICTCSTQRVPRITEETRMNEEMVKQLMATAERLATAAESLDRVLGRLDAQQEALNAKVDRIVASVDAGEQEER